jgi:hypothetical protein
MIGAPARPPYDPTVTPARELWSVYEPVHVICYFHPDVSGCLAAEGLHGFWNGYFAGRAAALGAVGPAPVTALFFGFAPAMVAKALPKVWGRITPEEAVDSRLEAAERVLAPMLDEAGPDVRRSIDALVRVALEVSTDGRALAAAWQGVSVPDAVGARLWWATTVLREHRGDGHVLAATHAGLTGLEAGLTHVASGRVTRATVQPNRGWTDDEWHSGIADLAARGLVMEDGSSLTSAGAALREQVEADTDRLASEQLELLGDEVELVQRVVGRIARAVAATGTLPTGNPMGLPLPPDGSA